MNSSTNPGKKLFMACQIALILSVVNLCDILSVEVI